MNVVVTDGETRAALALTRALGRSGHTVHVCAAQAHSLAGCSRWCAAEFLQAGPESAPGRIAASIVQVVRSTGSRHLLAMTDRTLTALHGSGPDLGPARIPAPAAQDYFRASDKAWLFERCREWSIPVPDGMVVPGGALPEDSRLEPLGPEWVVRPALSWRWDGERWITGKVAAVRGRAELEAHVASDPACSHPYLVQRRIRGVGCGLFLSAHAGRLLAVFAHQRIREKPPWGGVSTLCRSTKPPADLRAWAERFVERAQWSGLAMLEFKREAASGTALLLEINARPWGSMALPLAAGVDFVSAWTAPERFDGARSDYAEGLRLRWWWGDVDHFYLRGKAAGRTGAGALAKAFAAALIAGPRAEVWDTFRSDDPLPFARETLSWLAPGR